MKQIKRRHSSTLYTLPFLIFVYVLLVTASFILASSAFPGMLSGETFTSPRGILILVLLPTGLLVFIAVFFWLQISESNHQGDSSKTGNRLFLVFCLIIAGASFPQSLISARYIGSSLDSWFELSVLESFSGSDRIASLYIESRNDLAHRVGDHFLNGLSISNFRAWPLDWMSRIRDIDSDAAACQVYLISDTDEADFGDSFAIVETGDSTRFLDRSRLNLVVDGILDIEDDVDMVREGRIVRYSGNLYVCVYTSLLPAGFTQTLAKVRTGIRRATVIETLKPFLPLMGIWIYLLFSLPPLLLLASVCWLLSRRFSDPAHAIAEATARLSFGDFSWRIRGRTSDDFGRAATQINKLTETKDATLKKGDKRAVLKL